MGRDDDDAGGSLFAGLATILVAALAVFGAVYGVGRLVDDGDAGTDVSTVETDAAVDPDAPPPLDTDASDSGVDPSSDDPSDADGIDNDPSAPDTAAGNSDSAAANDADPADPDSAAADEAGATADDTASVDTAPTGTNASDPDDTAGAGDAGDGAIEAAPANPSGADAGGIGEITYQRDADGTAYEIAWSERLKVSRQDVASLTLADGELWIGGAESLRTSNGSRMTVGEAGTVVPVSLVIVETPDGTLRWVGAIEVTLRSDPVARWEFFPAAGYSSSSGAGAVWTDVSPAADTWKWDSVPSLTSDGYVVTSRDGRAGDDTLVALNGLIGDASFVGVLGFDDDDRIAAVAIWHATVPWSLMSTDGTPPTFVQELRASVETCLVGRSDAALDDCDPEAPTPEPDAKLEAELAVPGKGFTFDFRKRIGCRRESDGAGEDCPAPPIET